MKTRVLTVLMGLMLLASRGFAQQKTVTGRVIGDNGAALSGVSVQIKGTNQGTATNSEGMYSIRASVGQVLQYRLIGHAPVEKYVGTPDFIDVQLATVARSLDAVVVTALGEEVTQRALGTAQQTVTGSSIAQSQRLNFVNALQGRVAGVEVVNTSGVPGAGSSITIRGISSISSSNQPLMIVDGLPLDNKTQHTATLASGRPGSSNSFENRNIDFTNRAADLNPEDIENVTVLKGPEAAALYGIDAANGAIVITTKRGRSGISGLEYSNSFTMQKAAKLPTVQRVYDVSGVGTSIGYLYWGDPYPAGTKFYDNTSGFFQTAWTQRHNMAFSGGSADRKINYRLSSSLANEKGVVPNSTLDKYNLTGSSSAQVTNWLSTDLSMLYTYSANAQPFKGSNSPLLGLLVWPQWDDAKNYLTTIGSRRNLTTLSLGSEYDNPYFNVNKNRVNNKDNRIVTNLALTANPVSWGYVKTSLGIDAYTNQNLILRHPESSYGYTANGILDVANDITRNISSQTLVNVNNYQLTNDIEVGGLIGNAIRDEKSNVDATVGQDFLDPNFVSINNTNQRYSQTTITQRRVISAFGQATIDYKKYLYLHITGRNDWTSTIPRERNSFFYPGFSASFVFTDAFPVMQNWLQSGKIRAAYAAVGRDAKPYAYKSSLEFKTTSYGGYGFGFTGPNPKLKPEYAKSWELGTELGFLDGRLNVDATYYSKQTYDQIVNNVRNSYATGFVLLNVNGARTKNAGVELTVSGTPMQRNEFEWDAVVNFDKSKGKTLKLPNFLPESYNSDSWLYGNVRNGTEPGFSTRSLTGTFYLRNKAGQLLIDPTTGLPIRNSNFVDGGYDRNPDFQLGLNNTLKYRDWSLDFLLDFRRGGDILNATQHFLTVRGLAMRTLDRWQPRVVNGVLRDGKENTATPTKNTIVIVPALNTTFYDSMSEEVFIEQDINWLRLRDVTLSYQVPKRLLSNASLFVTATDLFLLTNYSGLDPLGSATSVATGGSGSAGIDYGGFALPRGLSTGLRMRF